MDVLIGAKAQGYAITIEHILCDIFECERFGFGGIVNSDHIRKYPYHAMTNGLAYIYFSANEGQRKKIDNFIDTNYFYANMSIDTLLSFETNSQIIDGSTYSLDYENGKAALEALIEQFRNLVNRR